MHIARTAKIVFATLSFAFSAANPFAAETYELAINSAVNPLLNKDFITKTIETIKKAVAPASLNVKYVELPQLEELIENKKADFFISTSGTLRRYSHVGVRDIATASSPFSSNPNKSEGSLIVVKANRDDLTDLASLKGLKVAAGRPTAFGMYLAAMGEIAKAGFDAKHFFSNTSFYGLERDEIIRDVLNGKADVGILRVCYLEDAINRKVVGWSDLKFINLKNDPEHYCLHSTALYPNWSLGSSPNVPASVVSAVTSAIILQKPTPLGTYWSIASDFTEIDRLHRALNIGTFEKFSSLWFQRQIYQYRIWLAAVALLFLALAAHSFLVGRAVRLRTQELKDSLERERELFEEAKAANTRLFNMQRAGVVGQVSGLIAHELNQPLASIKLYARALQRSEENGSLNSQKLKEILEDIRSDADIASAIVERVRSYAKGTASSRELTDVVKLTQKSVREFYRQTGKAFPVEERYDFQPKANLNRLEFELVIINLLRNASQSLQKNEIKDPQILLTVSETEKRFVITVEDSGRIDSEALKKLSEPSSSEKADGLGLGLSIVKTIVENHGGKIVFRHSRLGGLAVEVYGVIAEQTAPGNQNQTSQ